MSWTLRDATWMQKTVLIAAAMMLIGIAFRMAVPASWWFEVRRFDVHAAPDWGAALVDYQRHIIRPFDGQWRSEIHREEGGGWHEVCASDWNPRRYGTDVALPDPVTLEWISGLTAADCGHPGPGDYRACLFWQVNTGSWLGILSRSIRLCDDFSLTGVPA